MALKDQIRSRVQQMNSAEKLILLNIICFIFPLFLKTLFFLFAIPFGTFISFFELSSDWRTLFFRPWSIVTYSFIHSGFFHLFWNMYLLYFSSRLFLNLFSVKIFLNVYFLAVVVGAFTFLFSYALFPAFQNAAPSMIGASAGVMGIFVFISTYSPDQEIRIIFFNLKLRYLAIGFVLMDIIQIPYGNAGGHLAHLGGAGLGFLYAQRLQNGIDIALPFERFIAKTTDLFKKKPILRTVHKKNISRKTKSTTTSDTLHQKQIDSILDKISTSGYESLSQKEKDYLFQAGKN